MRVSVCVSGWVWVLEGKWFQDWSMGHDGKIKEMFRCMIKLAIGIDDIPAPIINTCGDLFALLVILRV